MHGRDTRTRNGHGDLSVVMHEPLGGIPLKKQIAVNLVLVFMFMLLSMFLYISGKGYDLLIDNQTVILNGMTYEARGTVRVYVDAQEPLELWIDDRDISSVIGKKHRIRVELLDEKEEKVIDFIEKDFLIDAKKGTLFSIPALLGGASDWVIPKK